MHMTNHTIYVLTPAEAQTRREALADLLVDAVEGGAGVNFVWPMTQTKAEKWWDGALLSQVRGERIILTAEAGNRVDGTVQLIPAPQENQSFRADVAKLLVHRRARNQGIAVALMCRLEEEARKIGRTLLTLDTETGGAGERLYARLGWMKYGEIPGYAMSANNHSRIAASFFYKEL
jgi:ribosomal protein S18 acetylase RimI-like enzyme